MSIGLSFLGLVLGFDSFVVGIGLGAPISNWHRRLRIALAFAFCDGLASFVGCMIGASWRSVFEWSEWLGPVALSTRLRATQLALPCWSKVSVVRAPTLKLFQSRMACCVS